jgi:6-phosphofructokinase 1
MTENDKVLEQALTNVPEAQQRSFLRAGPRRLLAFDPEKVKAAIVTCGGLCPGLNAVIHSVVNCLERNYGVREIWGISYGYMGFYSEPWRKLTVESVDGIHMLGGSMLSSSRGGFDLKLIVDAIEQKGISQGETDAVTSIF